MDGFGLAHADGYGSHHVNRNKKDSTSKDSKDGVDPDTGMLSLHGHHPTGGIEPRHFTLDPTGRWCLVAHCGELGDGATPSLHLAAQWQSRSSMSIRVIRFPIAAQSRSPDGHDISDQSI